MVSTGRRISSEMLWCNNSLVALPLGSIFSPTIDNLQAWFSQIVLKCKTVKRVVKDSDWISYKSSCKPLQKEIEENPEQFHKEILHWCFSKKNMSLMETVEQVRHNVLWVVSYNDHIQNWYRYDTDRELYAQHLQRMREIPRKPRKKKEVY